MSHRNIFPEESRNYPGPILLYVTLYNLPHVTIYIYIYKIIMHNNIILYTHRSRYTYYIDIGHGYYVIMYKTS